MAVCYGDEDLAILVDMKSPTPAAGFVGFGFIDGFDHFTYTSVRYHSGLQTLIAPPRAPFDIGAAISACVENRRLAGDTCVKSIPQCGSALFFECGASVHGEFGVAAVWVVSGNSSP